MDRGLQHEQVSVGLREVGVLVEPKLTSGEIQAGREQIKTWPLWDRTAVTQLTEREARLVVLAAGLLELRPCDPGVIDPRAEVIDLR